MSRIQWFLWVAIGFALGLITVILLFNSGVGHRLGASYPKYTATLQKISSAELCGRQVARRAARQFRFSLDKKVNEDTPVTVSVSAANLAMVGIYEDGDPPQPVTVLTVLENEKTVIFWLHVALTTESISSTATVTATAPLNGATVQKGFPVNEGWKCQSASFWKEG